MFHATIHDMIIYMQKDEHDLKRSNGIFHAATNAIRIHHALATKAADYTKKQYVFRLKTSDAAQYLFQTG